MTRFIRDDIRVAGTRRYAFGDAGETPALPEKFLSRREFKTTETLEKLMASEAIIGFSTGPPKICKTPIAAGIPIIL
jgi:hypothetical protein